VGDAPLTIHFVTPSSLLRESHRASALPIVGNGPPGTFVVLPGLKVSLPTDQIVLVEEVDGHVRAGFGGMRFTGVDGGQLTFVRFREVLPEEQLSPARSHTMRLNVEWVARVVVEGRAVWDASA
jgi:hypothetical protein